jgi:hypothetical protein
MYESATSCEQKYVPKYIVVRLGDERHLAEAVTGPADSNRDRVPERSHDPDRKSPLVHQMQRVSRVLAVEDDLIAGKAAAACDRKQTPQLLLGNAVHQSPTHARNYGR